MRARAYPSFDDLHHRYDLAPDGASLIWRNPRSDRYIGLPVAITVTSKGYARIMWGRRPLFLHRVLWKMWNGEDAQGQIDHINGNRLDNRRTNLRLATQHQNQRNMLPRGGESRFKGVYRGRRLGTWGARIKVNGKTKHLGTFALEEDAAQAYDKAAQVEHGAFCLTNEVLGLY